MDTTIYRVAIRGDTPMIQHSTDGMLDTDARVIELRTLAKKTASKRTAAEIARIAELETSLSIYWKGDRPTIPAANIRATIEKAARMTKDGPRVRRGLVVNSAEFHSADYSDSDNREDIIQKAMFQSVVKVGQSRVVRTRAMFKDWRIVAEIECLDDLVDRAALTRWLEAAGRLIGLGDWRPDTSGIHGRFSVESVEAV